VPDDGERYAIVGWKQWSELLLIDEFASSLYAGSDELPFANITQAKHWLGTLWMPHSGLTAASNIRSCFWYHRTALGHASASDVTTDITWHEDDPNYRKLLSADENDPYFAVAEGIAALAVAGNLDDITHGATHYHAVGATPGWAYREKPVAVVGRHIFYRLEI